MAQWPGDLPKRPPDGAWTITLMGATQRNVPERGPPMTRRRASVSWEVLQGVFLLTGDQMRSLRTFWQVTTSYGADVFEGWHWRELVIYNMTFADEPGPEEHVVGDYYRVPVSLIRKPI